MDVGMGERRNAPDVYTERKGPLASFTLASTYTSKFVRVSSVPPHPLPIP